MNFSMHSTFIDKNRHKPFHCNLAFSPMDWTFEVLAGFALVAQFSLYFYYSAILPEVVPIYFDLSGSPVAYDSKSVLIALPLITLAVYSLFSWLCRIPHLLPYPVKLNRENVMHQYTLMSRMLIRTKFVVTLFLSYLTYAIISSAMQFSDGLSPIALPLFIVLLISVIGYYTTQSLRDRG